jgi:hypothetical protein
VGGIAGRRRAGGGPARLAVISGRPLEFFPAALQWLEQAGRSLLVASLIKGCRSWALACRSVAAPPLSGRPWRQGREVAWRRFACSSFPGQPWWRGGIEEQGRPLLGVLQAGAVLLAPGFPIPACPCSLVVSAAAVVGFPVASQIWELFSSGLPSARSVAPPDRTAVGQPLQSALTPSWCAPATPPQVVMSSVVEWIAGLGSSWIWWRSGEGAR